MIFPPAALLLSIHRRKADPGAPSHAAGDTHAFLENSAGGDGSHAIGGVALRSQGGDAGVTGDMQTFSGISAGGVMPVSPEGWRGGHRGVSSASPGEWRPWHLIPPSRSHPQRDGLTGAFPETEKEREPASERLLVPSPWRTWPSPAPCRTSLPPPSPATGEVSNFGRLDSNTGGLACSWIQNPDLGKAEMDLMPTENGIRQRPTGQKPAPHGGAARERGADDIYLKLN
ncbi:MAG: hypothetical protein JWM59_103 [Verrucomicrobiales bacterium]|nr:hypothetical protein [Verrucomicrobiales bacterium]